MIDRLVSPAVGSRKRKPRSDFLDLIQPRDL
jgi:hypothetical protein